ncbi:hypothetical protein B0H14DRAFT_3487683 [Mycena olivaceomarginata]|nr:hypothetical protein B0H14DRAFT_3487683 [Mycena olivaceomarginata]
MNASHEVGGVQNGSSGTGTSTWEHMPEKRVRDLKAAAAEAKQRMEVSIAADIVSGKIKPKAKRNRQLKSAKQIDEDDYNGEDSSLPCGAPAFAVVGSAAHLRVLHRTQSRSPPIICTLFARARVCSIRPLAPAQLPRWPTICTPPHNCKPHHKLLRTPCTRPSYLPLQHCTSRTATLVLPPHALPTLLARFRTTSLPTCSLHAACLRLHSAPHTYSPAITAQRIALVCPHTRRPPAPRWPTLTPCPVRVSIPLAFTAPPHMHPLAAAALARTSCVCTFIHARRAHTPLVPRPQGM